MRLYVALCGSCLLSVACLAFWVLLVSRMHSNVIMRLQIRSREQATREPHDISRHGENNLWDWCCLGAVLDNVRCSPLVSTCLVCAFAMMGLCDTATCPIYESFLLYNDGSDIVSQSGMYIPCTCSMLPVHATRIQHKHIQYVHTMPVQTLCHNPV